MILVNILIATSLLISFNASIFAIVGIISGLFGRNIAVDMLDDLEDKQIARRELRRRRNSEKLDGQLKRLDDNAKSEITDGEAVIDNEHIEEVVVEELLQIKKEGNRAMSESAKQNITFACAKCAHEIEMNVYTNVDSKKDVESVKQIVEGKFFLRECERCGKVNVVAFPVSYKDADKNKFIFFCPSTASQGFKESSVPEYYRLTYDMMDFTEKVRIAEMGFDDKIVEIVKVAALNQVVNDGIVVENLTGIGCWVNDDGSLELEVCCGDNHYILQATHEMYLEIEEEFGEILKHYNEPRVVDLNWATMLMRSITIEAENASLRDENDDNWDEIVFE